MKKFLLFFLTPALFTTVNAQIKLGINAGVVGNLPKLTPNGSILFTRFNVKNYTTPIFGIVAQFNAGPVAIRPALNYLRSGYTTESLVSIFNSTSKTVNNLDISNIEVPLDVVYPVKLGKGNFLISAAPSITIGLKGTIASQNFLNGSSTGTTSSSAINFGNANGELKKIALGSRFGFGYEFANGLQINAAYKLDLTNLSNQSDEEYKNHHLAITAVWYFIK